MMNFVKTLKPTFDSSGPHVFGPDEPEPPTRPPTKGIEELHLAAKKIKLPEFNGYDPRGWISKAETYFEIHETPPSIQLRLAKLSMSGVAQHWFSVVEEVQDSLTWEIFTTELLQRFSGLEIENPFEQLSMLYQSGTVQEYIEDFEYLQSLVPALTEPQALGYFIGGLQSEIRRRVRPYRPKTRLTAMCAAKDVEAMLLPYEKEFSSRRLRKEARSDEATYRSHNPFIPNRPEPKMGYNLRPELKSPYPNVQRIASAGGTNATKQDNQISRFSSSQNRNRGFRSLTRTEWEERRKKGLCYRCGQAYGPAHKCPEGKLRVILLADDEEVSEEGEILRFEGDGDEDFHAEGEAACEAMGECKILEFSGMSAIPGQESQTLKLSGELMGIPIEILVDSGATHNFLSRKLAEVLGIPIVKFTGMSIKLGDGHRVIISEKCRDLPISLDEFKCSVEALVFDMGNLDMVLGIEWLKTLGEVTHNWDLQYMRFNHENQEFVLRGINRKLSEGDSSLHNWLKSSKSTSPTLQILGTEKEEEESQLTTSQKQDLDSLIGQFESQFHAPTSLPPSRLHDHGINLLPGQGPVCVRPYRYPYHQKTEIQRQVDELLEMGAIRSSKSAFSSPVILVKKKDGSWRMCVDYRALNKVTIPDKFPIPVVDELIDELKGAQFFTKLDLASGFNQIRMKEDSIEKTAFRTHDGHYEYLVMPFGLTNAPATFQSVMNDLFRPHLRRFVLVFFDDILIYSHSWSDHLFHLSIVMKLLAANQFFVKRKKCDFGRTSVEYLGHIITGSGVSMDPKKVQAVVEWPVPKQVKGVRGFLGLTGYYRKFIRNYGSIARPLTEQTKKNAFHWSLEAQTAFEQLKSAIVSAPVLALPDFSIPFVVECDASGRGIGAVLMQNRRPIAYFSKALSDRNLAKSAYEREIMALALAVQHWRPYLLGAEFTVYTDQKSLRHLLQQRVTTPDQQNWVAKLLGYNFSICYKPGRENRAADALSRRDEDGELFTLVSIPTWVQGAQMLEEVKQDPQLLKIISDLEQNIHQHPGYSLQNGVLFYKKRLVLSKTSSWIPKLISEFHNTKTGGHSGYYRTYRRLAANLYWVGMAAEIQKFVQACDVCQRCKASSLAPGGLLQPLDIPEVVWEHVSMDFILGLPKSNGYDAILVVVDRLSKYSHFVSLKHPYSAKSIAAIFVREVVRHHGIPKSILSDRDPIFVSQFWQELFKLQGTQLRMSSSYHPETDGQTEVINRCLESYLRCFAVEQPRLWSSWIPWAEFWYNTTFHSSTGVTPFEIVYGRQPPTIVQFFPGEVKVESVRQELQSRDEALRQLKVHLHRAQEQMKAQADKHRRLVNFSVGEWVYLKLRPYRQISVSQRVNHKLSAKYFGPFQITAKIGPVAYRLQLPDSSKIHPVFHVSLLKRAVVTQPVEASLPRDFALDVSDHYIPAAILDCRTHEGSNLQWLILWQGKPVEDATWEDALSIKSQFPTLCLEDKTISDGGSIDRDLLSQALAHAPQGPRIIHVYSRKKKTTASNE
ncbi:Transposon Tf2-6 polyprotein [Euphorbia peplus]|nr:Transposon Tf2-6 polyprotein [Euphorbia peplus]